MGVRIGRSHLEFGAGGESGGDEWLVVFWTENPAARLRDVPLVGEQLGRTREALNGRGVRYRNLERLRTVEFIDWSAENRLG